MSGTTVKKASHAVIVIGSLVIIALVGVIVALVFVMRSQKPQIIREGAAPEARPTLVSEANLDEAVDRMLTPVESGYLEVTQNFTWNFPDGASPSTNAYVENSRANANDFYFDLELEETGEILYASPIIPLGNALSGFALDKDLEAGVYPCVIVYHRVDDHQRPISALRIKTTVVVES